MTKYAAIIPHNIYHEGDERSRTNPGHGYSAWTETIDKFRKFKDRAEMLQYVEYQSSSSSYSKDKYQLIEYTELNVKTTISVEIK